MAWILFKAIVSLFVILIMGFLLVKLKLLKSEDSKIFSTTFLYIIMPCVIISAFQVDFTAELRNNLLLAALAAAISEGVFIGMTYLLNTVFHFNGIEKASLIYTNAGNVVIPLVTAILGKEWVIYSSVYIAVQRIFMFSHGVMQVSGERGYGFKKIFLNFNMLTIYFGIFLLVSGIRFPAIIETSIDNVAAMTGPFAMIVTGMVLGRMKWKEIVANPRVWLIVALRLAVLPIVMLAILKLTPLSALSASGVSILLTTLLASSAPTASNITQFALIYDKDSNYAAAINMVSIICCILTMPLMVMLYQL